MIKISLYLDNAATTKVSDSVIAAMMPYFSDKWQNPSSLYAADIDSKIRDARKIIGKFIGDERGNIFFTSGGSESNCWAIEGFVNRARLEGYNPVIITSKVEHKSILECVKNIDTDAYYIPVHFNGTIYYDELDRTLSVIAKGEIFKNKKNKILVSIQYANNETGAVQDIQKIAAITHSHGGFLHVDATQAFGKIPIDVVNDADVSDLDTSIDMLTASGHKIGTPKGIGFLYIKDESYITPIIYGSQNYGMRGGTENVPYIMGLKQAVQDLEDGGCCNQKVYENLKLSEKKRDLFADKLHFNFNCRINGYYKKIPNIISVTFLDAPCTAESMVYLLELDGIFVSAGSACNSHSDKPSYVLSAMGLDNDKITKTLRISFDNSITEDNMDKFVSALKKCFATFDKKGK